MNKQAERIVDGQQNSTENTEDRKKVETLVDGLLDKVMGGAAQSELCQHCNQPCGDCTQPT